MERKTKSDKWPHWAHKSKRDWKRDSRKRWVALRKAVDIARLGCAYYPPEAYDFIQNFKKADKEMRNFYKE